MKGIAYWFMVLAALNVLVGMVWGIQMSISHDHTLSPAHGHLNLIGFVAFAIFAVYYHVVPAAAASWLAFVHLSLSVVGLVVLVPGIALAILEVTEGIAALGSILSLLALVLFAVIVLRHRDPVRSPMGAVAAE